MRKQREMWGESLPDTRVATSDIDRDDPSIPQQPYTGRIRRPYRHSETGRGRIPSDDRTLRDHETAGVSRAAVCVAQSGLFTPHRAWSAYGHES